MLNWLCSLTVSSLRITVDPEGHCGLAAVRVALRQCLLEDPGFVFGPCSGYAPLCHVSGWRAHSEEFSCPGLPTPATECPDVLYNLQMASMWSTLRRAPDPQLSVSACLKNSDSLGGKGSLSSLPACPCTRMRLNHMHPRGVNEALL